MKAFPPTTLLCLSSFPFLAGNHEMTTVTSRFLPATLTCLKMESPATFVISYNTACYVQVKSRHPLHLMMHVGDRKENKEGKENG